MSKDDHDLFVVLDLRSRWCRRRWTAQKTTNSRLRAVYISSSTIIINEWNVRFFFGCCYILLSCCCWISIIDELMCIYSLPIRENSLAQQRTETPLCCGITFRRFFRSRRWWQSSVSVRGKFYTARHAEMRRRFHMCVCITNINTNDEMILPHSFFWSINKIKLNIKEKKNRLYNIYILSIHEISSCSF